MGKVAVITGGNGGIGLGCARGLARAGATIVIWARDKDKNAAAKSELEALGATVITLEVDVTDRAAVESATARTIDSVAGLTFSLQMQVSIFVCAPKSTQKILSIR